eukprot:1157065-Pelagomonas_calceolata.AAC.12
MRPSKWIMCATHLSSAKLSVIEAPMLCRQTPWMMASNLAAGQLDTLQSQKLVPSVMAYTAAPPLAADPFHIPPARTLDGRQGGGASALRGRLPGPRAPGCVVRAGRCRGAGGRGGRHQPGGVHGWPVCTRPDSRPAAEAMMGCGCSVQCDGLQEHVERV